MTNEQLAEFEGQLQEKRREITARNRRFLAHPEPQSTHMKPIPDTYRETLSISVCGWTYGMNSLYFFNATERLR